jgi:hypothetical protein
MLTGLGDLLRYTHATSIVGDILKVRANDIGLGDMAIVGMADGEQSLAQVIQLEGEEVSLRVFGGGKGLSTQAMVRFLGHPTQVTYSPNILGRVFRGDGTPIDGGPDLSGNCQVDIGGPSVNPVTRIVPTNMIRTNVPMIDVFNYLHDGMIDPFGSLSRLKQNVIIAAWRLRHAPNALGALGWAVIILSGFSIGLGQSCAHLAALATIGWGGLVLVGLLVLLFTSERPFSLMPMQLLGRLVDGLKGATQLTQEQPRAIRPVSRW